MNAFKKPDERQRESSIELFRIITMLCIVAHHYVVNSGLIQEITQENIFKAKTIFMLLFGWGGKTGINCFVLITGYFMCTSKISLRKFLKLLLEVEFYKIVIYMIFLLTGYSVFSLKSLIKTLLPIYGIGTGFTSSFLAFYLFIPYLNLLIGAMDKKKHRTLILICLFVDSVLQTFMFAPIAFTYVGWFMTLYFISSYIRIYPNEIFRNKKTVSLAFVTTLTLSVLSILACAFIYYKTGIYHVYYFVGECNRLLAAATGVCAFLFFINLNLKYNPLINRVAGSAFGVLLIHANSDTMRQWLWKDLLDNVGWFQSDYFVIHALLSVLIIYVVCTLIDMLRIKIFETPFFHWYDVHFSSGKKGLETIER